MKFLCFLLLLFTLSLQAQFHIRGIVKDADSKKTLPFASIRTENGFDTITDVDGKFDINLTTQPQLISFSYLGYATKTLQSLNSQSFLTVYLLPKTDMLKEVIITAENPANAIIAKVIQHKNDNNPQHKLHSFTFKSYNKLVVTANPDSIVGKIDTLFTDAVTKDKIVKIDSSDYKFKKIISKQHLFLTEKVSRFEFEKPILKETILGTKMAGFKEPIYELLGFSLQSFSIYDNTYELFETKYKSPIAKNASKEYRYHILDTITIDNRKVIVIYFKNKKTSKGLEGLLYVDPENFAIAKAVMRIRGVLNITGVHEFQYLANENIWFPTRKNFKIVKVKRKQQTTILGGRIEFDAEDDGTTSNQKRRASDYTYLSSEMHIFDIKVNPSLHIKKSFIAIDVKENANNQGDIFWKTNRIDSLDRRGEKTYVVLDSLVTKRKIEKKIRFGRKIINGYLPVGCFDFDMRYLLTYNNFEGFRWGVGGITNEYFSKKFRLEGYTGYGLKDETLKYNLGAAFKIGNASSSWLGGTYTDDVREIASTNFATDKRTFRLYDSRPFNISTFYNHKTWRAYLETKIIPKTESIWQLSHSDIHPLFDYTFAYDGKLYHDFSITTALFSMQWNPNSDFMQTPNGRIEFEKRFPKFSFQYTKSLPGISENHFAFDKIDVRIEYEKKYLNDQKSTFLVQAGYAFGAVPITHLYSTLPNNLTGENIIEQIKLAGKNSFETMYYNEFFSSEYIMFQFKHGFKRIPVRRNIKPSIVFVNRMAWGNMQYKERHIGIDYKTLDRGYFESGIELNQIYKGFGLGGFYRYGPNQTGRLQDDLAIKFSFLFSVDF
jgi:hypothetical protein